MTIQRCISLIEKRYFLRHCAIDREGTPAFYSVSEKFTRRGNGARGKERSPLDSARCLPLVRCGWTGDHCSSCDYVEKADCGASGPFRVMRNLIKLASSDLCTPCCGLSEDIHVKFCKVQHHRLRHLRANSTEGSSLLSASLMHWRKRLWQKSADLMMLLVHSFTLN